MSWVVVKFIYDDNSSEVEAVPSTWIVNGNKCLWPSNKRGILLKKAIKTCDTPSEDWTQYNIKVLSNVMNKFDVASAKATRAQFSSDLDEENYNVINSKRVIKKNVRYLSSSEENSDINEDKSSSEEDCSQLQLPKPPTSEKNGNLVIEPRIEPIVKKKNDSSQRNAAIKLQDSNDASAETTTCSLPEGEVGIHKFGNTLDILLKQNVKFGRILLQQNVVLDEINRTLNTLVDKVINLNVHNADEEVSNTAVNHSDVDNLIKKLPVSSDEIMIELNQILQQESQILEAVAKKLSSVGGENYKECVRRIAPRILTDSVTQCYSWLGHKGKKRFSKTAVANLIIKSVQRATKNETSDKDIEKYIALWLTKAPERLKRTAISVENESVLNHQE